MDAAPVQGRLPEGELTMLFSDIEGSTRLLHEIGDVYGDVLEEHHRVLRAVWPRHGGIEVHADGDAFLVVFHEPRTAIEAAAAAQAALAAHEWAHGGDLRVRMGVHTGDARVRHDDYWGIDVHYAARLCSAAHGGQVLLSATTRSRLPELSVTDLGDHALKDFPAARRLYHLNLAGRSSSEFPPPRTIATVRSNLPTLQTRLVGREAELAALRDLLDSGERLVTLTGIGGSGKTALALAFGADLVDGFEDGVFLAELASVGDAGGVPAAIGAAVRAPLEDGRDPMAVVSDHLERRELLLIIDNMEHLLDAATVVSELVDRAPRLRVLVTSQTPLRVRGEAVLPLGSLALPEPDERDPAALRAAPAVALFLERARAMDAHLSLAPDDLLAVAELCRRLEGIPLAIELAAARVHIMRPRQLSAALERGIEALGSGARDLPARQRGLHAALDWTVSQLSAEQRTLFAGVGTFADAWTLEQLECMFGDELDVWESSAALMDFSLIATRGDGRFTMAERVRRYAQKLLDADVRADDLRARHARMLAETAEAISDEILLDVVVLVPSTFDLMREFSAAIRWSRDGDRELYARLVAALGLPYYLTGALSSIATDIMELVDAGAVSDHRVAARLFQGEAMVRTSRTDNDAGGRALVAAAERWRAVGDARGEALALGAAAHLLSFVDDDYAGELLQAARRLPLDDRRIEHVLDAQEGVHLVCIGEIDAAEAIFTRSLHEQGRTDFGANFAASYLGDIAIAREDYDTALMRYAQALREVRGTQLHNVLLQCFGIATALAGVERDADAIELMAAVDAVGRRDGGVEIREDMTPESGSLLATARERLGPDAVDEARRRGRRRELDDLVDWALEVAGQPVLG